MGSLIRKDQTGLQGHLEESHPNFKVRRVSSSRTLLCTFVMLVHAKYLNRSIKFQGEEGELLTDPPLYLRHAGARKVPQQINQITQCKFCNKICKTLSSDPRSKYSR